MPSRHPHDDSGPPSGGAGGPPGIRPLDRVRRVLVMGLGRFGGGAGAARFWAELGADVTVTDRDSREALAASVAGLADLPIRYALGGHREEDFARADVVVVNQAVRPDDPFVARARAAGADIVTEIALVWRLLRGPILAVTGSNGKSTTTALLGDILRRRDPGTLVGGNLGGSLLPRLRTHRPSAPTVLELSSFQLHYLKPERPAPDVAVVTNLSPNHLDWHRTTLHYYESKRVLLNAQTPDQWAVLRHADPVLREWGEGARAQVCWTGLEDPGAPHAAFARDDALWFRRHGREQRLAAVGELLLPGRHNRENALQAAAAALCLRSDDGRPEADLRAVREALTSFRGLPHRLETVAVAHGRRFVNDSKATTPDAAGLALDALDGTPLAVIVGGYDKGQSFADLGRKLAERAVAVAATGATGPAIRDAVRAAGGRAPALHDAADFEDAVRWAYAHCPEGGVVLLSPGCASWGQFKNFEERGARFASLARELAAVPPPAA